MRATGKGHEGRRIQVGWADCAELAAFRAEVERFGSGEISAEEFKSLRLRMGVYGQRQADNHMVRVKVPGGHLTANQLAVLGRLADQFADGQTHVTTRQDVQFHYVRLAEVPRLLELLGTVGLTTREACGNAVRNVTACPLAGLCAREAFDVYPHACALARGLLRHPHTQQLPRKFKIAFSGCGDDCALAVINDIGLLARTENHNGRQRPGFRLLVGGGLGNWPQAAQPLAEFVPVEGLQDWVAAILAVFDQFGNRRDRNRARLKFVLAEKGWEWFREQVFAGLRQRGAFLPPPESPSERGGSDGEQVNPPAVQLREVSHDSRLAAFHRWLESNVWPQRQPGFVAAWVTLPTGTLTSAQCGALAELARGFGDATLRTTPTQDVILPNVPAERLEPLYASLTGAGLALAGAREINDVTSCPGAETCNLGLTTSRRLALELSRQLRAEEDSGTRAVGIKVSGCPNACGQHHIADIGLHGLARKVNGQPAPFYQVLLGGRVHAGIATFGRRVVALPARRIPEAVARLLALYRSERHADESFAAFVSRKPLDDFRRLLADLGRLDRGDPDLDQDWGESRPYRLSVGEGECAS